MAARLANFTCFLEARATAEPEPNRRSPREFRVRGYPFRILQERALVATKLFAELTVVIIPGELLWPTTLVLLASLTWVDGVFTAVCAACLLHKAQAPTCTTTISLAVTPRGPTRTRAVTMLDSWLIAPSTCSFLRHLPEPGSDLAFVVIHVI